MSDGVRDHLPTYPCDLSDYARIHTGPESWSAQTDDLREVLNEPDAMRAFLDDEPIDSVIDGPMIEVRRSDIPCATDAAAYVEPVLDERERRVLALVDGASSIGELLDRGEVAEADMVEALTDLSLRGVVVFTTRGGSVRDLDVA